MLEISADESFVVIDESCMSDPVVRTWPVVGPELLCVGPVVRDNAILDGLVDLMRHAWR